MKRLDRILQRWRIAKAVPFIAEGSRIFDIGSADGQLFKVLGDRISFSIGVDPLLSETIEGPNYRLIPALFPAHLPAEKNYDVITMLAVLEHFPEEALLKCSQICWELLDTGGYVVVTTPSKYLDGILSLLRFLRLVDAETLEEHHGFEVSMVSEIFSSAHFKLIAKRKFQLGFNNLFVFQKK
jgi:hypothetical protein